jgi:BirA family biotin operon repressor/biotin-[acetyl-CoA-carboxylase] ligase
MLLTFVPTDIAQKYYLFSHLNPMADSSSFHIIEHTESTNNDAIFLCRSKNPPHGTALFARFQTAGKGQRGQHWESEPDANLLMSVLLKNPLIFSEKPFLLSMLVAVVCRQLLAELLTTPVHIKWPNDLIIADRKAGGVLIENIYRGKEWQWAVAGIGININQTVFPEQLKQATSIKILTSQNHDSISLAQTLQHNLVDAFDQFLHSDEAILTEAYNSHLYKKEEEVELAFHNQILTTTIKQVDSHGNLQTADTDCRTFRFGEVSWIWE